MTWLIFPDSPLLSMVVLAVVGLLFLYAARRPIHDAIMAITRAVAQALRVAALTLARSAQELRARNKLVLLAHAREEVTQAIDREFQRVTALVQRDLQGYPALQRKLLEDITRLEEDYRK